jgi:outer membrane receptor protein involved in Fe transport
MRRHAKRRYGPIRAMGFWALSIFLLGMPVCPGHAQIRAHAKEAVPAEEKETEAGTAVHLDDMTVMAPQPGVEITTEKTVIRMDEFKKPGNVRTLTDILTEIGGVDIQRANPIMASPGDEVSIRGLNEGRMVIEINGRRINHTGHYGRYIVDWSTLNMDDVERVEIIRGGHSVLHPFAIGGVINIITKKGKRTADLKPDIRVKAGYGDYNSHFETASVRGGAGNILGYNFSASKQETDGFLRNNYQETDSFNGQLTFYLPGNATLDFSARYSDVLYGLPVINDPSRPDYDSKYPYFFDIRDQLRHIDWPQYAANDPHWKRHTTYLDGIFQMPLGPGALKLHYFMTVGRRWTSIYNAMGTFTEDDFSDDKTEGFIVEYKDIDLSDNHRLTAGIEYQGLGAPSDNPIIYQVKSAYLQDVIRAGNRWTLTPGVRYYEVEKDTNYSQFGSGWPTEGKEEEDEGFYPSLKVDFQATPETALYAAASRSYRLPCP